MTKKLTERAKIGHNVADFHGPQLNARNLAYQFFRTTEKSYRRRVISA